MFNWIFTKFQIWRLKMEISSLEDDIWIHYLLLNSRNNKFFAGKLDIEKDFQDFRRNIEIKKKEILDKIEILKLKLK